MHIKRKRVVKIDNYLAHIPEWTKFYVSSKASDLKRIETLGFSMPLRDGESLLPPVVGPVSNRNANWTWRIRKDLPMETRYRQQPWELEDWGGNLHSGIAEIPYQRYQRELVNLFECKLSIASDETGEKIVLSEPLLKTGDAGNKNKHVLNLFLESFWECVLLDENLAFSLPPVKYVDWEILSAGQITPKNVLEKVATIIDRLPKNDRVPAIQRQEHLCSLNPAWASVWRGWFHGYINYGFPKLGIFISESILYGHAMYIFRGMPEDVTRLSKQDILNSSLQDMRIIHKSRWKNELAAYIANLKKN